MWTSFVQSVGKFYGADWAGMIFLFLQFYTLGNKKRYGFLLGLGANVSWFAFGFLAGSVAQMIANVLFAFTNIRGYLRWKKS